jgi:hypothetical protein
MIDRVLQAAALGVTLTAVLVLAMNPLSRLWQETMSVLIQWLALDAQILSSSIHAGRALLGVRLGINMEIAAPDLATMALHGMMCIGVFGLSWAARSMPLRCGLRVLCGLHFLGLLMTVVQGDAFAYTLLDHTRALYDSAVIWLFLTPGLLAAGFYLVERSWLNRLAASAVLLGFEIISLPLKLVLHCALVTLLSTAAIPLLFLAAGPVLDILLLAALYAWVLTWPQLSFRHR